MSRRTDELTSFARYTRASERAARQIIAAYSSSFATACRLLGPRHRTFVRSIYALVRVADELVDGATAEAGIDSEHQHLALAALEAETERAMQCGYSSNPVVHAFAQAARASGISPDLTRPFFASMRSDLPAHDTPAADANAAAEPVRFDGSAHADYVHGSAEVIGLMCLRVFIREEHRTDAQRHALEHGACQLGAAFQNVNFLRDLADDTGRLGRSYLTDTGVIDTAKRDHWIAVIRQQLADANATLPLLPADARIAVACALRLFSRLTERIAQTPAAALYQRRIRVSGPQKALIVAHTVLTSSKGRAT